MWEINLSPGFRADESRYAAFIEMAEGAAGSARATVVLQMRAIVDHDTSARLGRADHADPRHPRHRRP